MSTLLRLPRAQRRAQLLTAAIDQFTQDGYHRTSMETIATTAGVTKPVLYQHFTSKDELYLEVVRSVGDHVVSELHDLNVLEGDAFLRIAHCLRRFSEILIGMGDSLRVLESSETISDEVSAATDEVLESCAQAIATVLVRSRELEQHDAEVLGRALTAMARASAAQLARARTPEERTHIIELLTSFITSGLNGFPALSRARDTARDEARDDARDEARDEDRAREPLPVP